MAVAVSRRVFMDKEDRRNIANALSMVSQLGFIALVSVGLSVLIGYWLDRWLGTSPVFIILFSLFGIIAAIRAMVSLAKKF